MEYRWSTWSTLSSCGSREATVVAPVHVASKYYIRPLNNVLIGSVPIDHISLLLLDVLEYGPPDGEPGLESRDAGNIYYLQGYTGDNKSW